MQFALLIYESPEAFASRKKIVAGAVSTGGLATLALKVSRKKGQFNRKHSDLE
jgi:hypothetical protein